MSFSVTSSYAKLRTIVESAPNDALPSPAALTKAISSLPASLPQAGLGEKATENHLFADITPGLNGSKTSSNYYGFVTGGVYPIAEIADNVVTAFDNNVGVHLPDQGVSTFVEDRALSMLVELLELGGGWGGKTFTTGATSANILGLACGREAIISRRLAGDASVGELGLLAACAEAGVKEIQVLTSLGHSSLYKAASVVGLGRASVKDVLTLGNEPWKLDISALEKELQRSKDGVVSIVAISAGEINTGKFATNGLSDMKRVRALCDEYGAWLHVDGAFGLFARSLPKTSEFELLHSAVSGLELADSITGDGHKMLNVPYDCGFFLTRSSSTLSAVFQNPNAAYLSSTPSPISSPLNIGLENSRRFRALPVYAVLLAYGRDGFAEMFTRQVRLARGISKFVNGSKDYELLPQIQRSDEDVVSYADVHTTALFRAKDEKVNEQLVKRINATRKMYVSGTKWESKPACRIAVSTWRVEVDRDMKLVMEVLEDVLKDEI